MGREEKEELEIVQAIVAEGVLASPAPRATALTTPRYRGPESCPPPAQPWPVSPARMDLGPRR